MKTRHITMSFEEYDRLPFEPGWKAEYWDGQAHIRPRETIVVGKRATHLALAALELEPGLKMVPLLDLDAELLPGFRAAFADTVEYCDWKRASFLKEARKVVTEFFSGKRGRPLSASCAVVDAKGKPVAVMMLVALRSGEALHDVLWVLPKWQRRGLATRMLAHVSATLAASGCDTLVSQWLLANEASVAWHRRAGFVEEPDLSLAQLYARAAEDELRRLRDSLSTVRILELEALAKNHRDTEAMLKRRMHEDETFDAYAIFGVERDRTEVCD